jgi:ketosteroid isomerase-like protein
MMRLYEWWKKPETTGDLLALVAPDVVWDRGLSGFKGEDMLWWVAQKPPWVSMRIIESIVADTRGVLVFEGTDTATGLRHRVAWLLEVENERVARVLETNARVEQQETAGDGTESEDS